MSAETQKVDVLAVMRGDADAAFEHRVNNSGDGHALYASQASEQARAAVAELIEASKDEARRSSITSLPLKIELARELGISLDEVDAWMLHAHRRFIAALDRVRGVS